MVEGSRPASGEKSIPTHAIRAIIRFLTTCIGPRGLTDEPKHAQVNAVPRRFRRNMTKIENSMKQAAIAKPSMVTSRTGIAIADAMASSTVKMRAPKPAESLPRISPVVLTRVARSFSERGFINFPTAAHKKIAPIDTWHTNAKYCAIIRLPHGSGGGKEREMV